MRRVLTVLIPLAVALLPFGTAAAAPPVVTTPSPFEVVIDFPDVCDFPMTATVRGRGLTITFVDAGGSVIRGFVGGQLFVTWTRTDTGFSRTFSIAGPSFLDAEGATIRGTGRWTTPMVDEGWVLAAGNLTFDGTEDGFALISSANGMVTSLCDLMS